MLVPALHARAPHVFRMLGELAQDIEVRRLELGNDHRDAHLRGLLSEHGARKDAAASWRQARAQGWGNLTMSNEACLDVPTPALRGATAQT